MKKIRTAVFSSIRSDYGVLRPFLDELQNDADFELLLLVAGGHLSERFGYTKKDIIADNRKIAAEFDFLVEPFEGSYLTKSLSKLQLQVGEWLHAERPDWVVVLGDRFELMPVATAALVNNIPLAHISGGDVTKGAHDNQVRHAVTKMSHVHFPANQEAKSVLLAMNEEEWRICVSGEPGLDQVLGMKYIAKEELFKDLGLDAALPTIIMTFHTDTLSRNINPEFVVQVIKSLIGQGFQLVVTGSNFDDGGDEINQALQKLAQTEKRMNFTMSLGQLRYYSMLRYAVLMVGNSSSGIIEAQSFNIPVINVGSRQLGRLSNPNVIHVGTKIDEVLGAVPRATSKEFTASFNGKPNLYGDGKACKRIAAFLKEMTGHKDLLVKS